MLDLMDRHSRRSKLLDQAVHYSVVVALKMVPDTPGADAMPYMPYREERDEHALALNASLEIVVRVDLRQQFWLGLRRVNRVGGVDAAQRLAFGAP